MEATIDKREPEIAIKSAPFLTLLGLEHRGTFSTTTDQLKLANL